MSLDAKNCNICLEIKENLLDSEEIAEDNVKFITKLTSCIPELDWIKGPCLLCPNCAQKLNLVYDFRKLCLKSFEFKFNSVVKSEAELSDPDDDRFNSNDTDDPLSNCNLNKENVKVEIQTSLCNSLLNKKFKTNRLRNVNRKSPASSIKKNVQDDKDEVLIVEDENVKELTCFNCDKTFLDKESLIEHFNEIHHEKDVNTYLNSKTKNDVLKGSSAKIKAKRGRKPIGKQIYQCTICLAVFSTKYLLSRHVRNVHATEKKYSCDICGQKFASPVYLSAHKRYHSGERPHICSSCGKGFITASDLYHHEKIHANKRSYKCDKCPKAFNTSSDLHKHNICVHMDRSKWKYVCTFCNKRFPLKTNMDTHVKIHTGEKNFPCHLCERRFINKSVLLRHIETHSNVRSFRCNVCNQEYKYQKSLDIHMTKTHGIGNAKIPERSKKYICHICPKAYYANSKLQKHIRTHTGERPFPCSVCEKKFIDKPCLNQHMKTAHSILFGILNN